MCVMCIGGVLKGPGRQEHHGKDEVMDSWSYWKLRGGLIGGGENFGQNI